MAASLEKSTEARLRRFSSDILTKRSAAEPLNVGIAFTYTAITNSFLLKLFSRGRDCQSVERPSGPFVSLPAFARQDGTAGGQQEQAFLHIEVIPQVERQPYEGMGGACREDERHLDVRQGGGADGSQCVRSYQYQPCPCRNAGTIVGSGLYIGCP